MAATTSRSHVRSRLLLALRQKPIDNLAALARELQVKRPSVSRAMHALSAEGLVSKVDEFWQLTPSGEAAALLVIDDLPERVQRTSVTVRRLMAQSELAAPSTQPLIRDMIAPIREAAATALALRFAPDLQLLSPMQDSMRSFLAAQDRQFAEVTKSLSSSVVDRAHLDSVHERFLAEGAKLAQMASAYDGAAAQVAKSAQAYESTVASAMREANALPSAQLAIARLADLLPATKLIDMALPSAETLVGEARAATIRSVQRA